MERKLNGYKALILAAGLSSRMKAFKPLLTLGNKTIIEHTINRFLEAGLQNSDISVVIGKQWEELAPFLDRLRVSYIINDRYATSDMFHSIQLGLRSMPEDIKGVLLSPGDIPLIKPSTIARLIEERERTFLNIIIPSFNNRRGHPILLGKEVISEAAGYQGKDGMHGFLEERKELIQYINVEDSFMLMDLDKPEDYKKVLELYSEGRFHRGEINERD